MLTQPQKDTVKAYIQADPVLSLKPATSQGAFEIAEALSAQAAGPFYVYRTNMPKQEVQDQINYANMTPAQSLTGLTGDALQQWIAKNLLAQGKQFNLQNLLLGSDSLNFALPNIKSGFQDALTNLPTKADGTMQAAGWPALQLKISRPASVIEKLLATGTGTQATPATMTFEGSVGYVEVQSIMGW